MTGAKKQIKVASSNGRKPGRPKKWDPGRMAMEIEQQAVLMEHNAACLRESAKSLRNAASSRA